MGAVTALLHADRDHSIAGMVGGPQSGASDFVVSTCLNNERRGFKVDFAIDWRC